MYVLKYKRKTYSNAPFLQILNPRHSPLRIDDHFAEKVGETRAAELRIARAVQVAVVDCFAVGRGAETGGRGGEGGFGGELETGGRGGELESGLWLWMDSGGRGRGRGGILRILRVLVL